MVKAVLPFLTKKLLTLTKDVNTLCGLDVSVCAFINLITFVYQFVCKIFILI